MCAAEVWMEALGKHPEDMTHTEARKARYEQQMNNQTTTQRLQPLSGGRKTRSAKQGTLALFPQGRGKEFLWKIG